MEGNGTLGTKVDSYVVKDCRELHDRTTNTIFARESQFSTTGYVYWNATFRLGLVHLLAAEVLVARHVDGRVRLEEISRSQMN